MDELPPRPVMPPKPSLPEGGAARKPLGLFPVLMVVMFALFCFGTLALLSLGFGAVVGFVGVLLFGVIGFHYLVWGWWLGPAISRAQAADDLAASNQHRPST